jgi:hypothetical protein
MRRGLLEDPVSRRSSIRVSCRMPATQSGRSPARKMAGVPGLLRVGGLINDGNGNTSSPDILEEGLDQIGFVPARGLPPPRPMA